MPQRRTQDAAPSDRQEIDRKFGDAWLFTPARAIAYWWRKLEGEDLGLLETEPVLRYMAARHGLTEHQVGEMRPKDVAAILRRDYEQRERPGAASPREPLSPARRSPGCRSVHWFGTDYSFTGTQGAVVDMLWDAWEQRTPDVAHETLLREAQLDTTRLRVLFKGHPAWGTLIVPGRTRGTSRLQEPPSAGENL
jgi:hypothetical protein